MKRSIVLYMGLYAWIVLALSACASWNHVEGSLFRNSTLHNLNPAPESMSPPPQNTGDNTIDPTYMRSQADYHYALAESLSLEGSIERAIEEFKLTLVYDPDASRVRVRLAAEYVKQGLLSEAIEEAEKAIEVEPMAIEAHLLLGGLYSTLKMYKQALGIYEKLQKDFPENSDVPLYMGALFAEQAKYDQAEKYFKQAAQHPKADRAHVAYFYLGKIRANQGEENYRKAELAFQKALQVEPSYEDAVLAMAGLYEVMKKPKQATRLVESFQEKQGPRLESARYLSQYYLDQEQFEKAYEQLRIVEGFEPKHLNVKVKIALILIEKKDFPLAIDKLEEIIRVDPTSDRIRFYLGAVYEEVSQYDLAIKHFSEILPTSTYFPEAAIHTSYLHKAQGRFDEAGEVLAKAIDARDDVPQFYSYYASLLDDQKQWSKAVKMLGAAVKKFPQDTQLRFYLGSMYDRTGQLELTIEEMRKVIEIDDEHVQALNYLAYTYAELNRELDEAERLARKAMELKPNDAYVMDTVGWVLFKKQEYSEAIKYLEAAYKAKPTESVVAEHLGDAYYKFQLVDKARQMYIKAVSIEQDQTKLAKLRSKLGAIEIQLNGRLPASTSAIPDNN